MTTLKANITAVRNLFGKRTSGFCASICGWTANGNDKETAVANLATKLERMEQFNHTRCYRVAPDGTVFALYYAEGWWYDIVHTDGTYSSCGLTVETYMQALEQMTKHHAQYSADCCPAAV